VLASSRASSLWHRRREQNEKVGGGDHVPASGPWLVMILRDCKRYSIMGSSSIVAVRVSVSVRCYGAS